MQRLDTVRLVLPKRSAGSQLLVAGADGLGLEVADAAAQSKRWLVIDFLHNDPPAGIDFGSWRVLGSLDKAASLHPAYRDGIVVLPGNERRVMVAREFLRLGYFVPCVVHSLGYVAESVRLDYGCIILAQSAVGPQTEIGMASVIKGSSSIGAHCSLGAGVKVGSGAHIGMGAKVGNYTEIGMGAIVEEGVSVGSRVTVSAGAVVDTDLPDGVIVTGMPARIVPTPSATRV